VCISEDKSAHKRLGLVCGLVYDPRGLTGVTTVRPGVPGVLQMVTEPTLTVARVRTGQRRGYVCMTCGSSGRDTV
jgi:hypothetical protein